nr:glutathione S-transferase [Saccharina japonica]
MAPKLILTYFGVEGIAEEIRWALELSGLEWEDKRLTREEFGVLKPSLPNGQVPVLVIDGYVLPQRLAILRYVAKLGGLFPTDDFEAAKCDAAIELSTDFYAQGVPYFSEKDETRKLEMRKNMVENFFPTWLKNIEKHLSKTEGVYFGDKMTVADITVARLIKSLKDGALDGVPTDIADSYPKAIALYDSIVGEPKIAAFIAKHAK